ncbi:multidrug effflux MFS transporter [Gryllotalpicola daejeonensis]|uniref:Multidrug effflux MFS transporter n=1 Tax=Gryllotalpicola daejeonensis TaxID=993087 RepID=A0ABP7ZJU1_9MICO
MGDATREDGLGLRLLTALSVLAATAPLSMDFYLPSFPQVLTSLHTDATQVQLTITAFLVGLGIGQVVWGPISDRFGRRRPLIVGAVATVVFAALSALAPNIEVLIGARFLQALTGAAGIVMSRAIIADRLQGFPAARALSLMQTITAAAPIVAPVVGGLLAGRVSWRWVLGIVFAITVIQLIGLLTSIPESLPPERRAARLRFGHLGSLLARPAFLGYTATIAFTFALMMAYISTSSFVYQRVLGFAPWQYGLLFALNACGLLLGGAASARLARHRVHPVRMVRIAVPTALGCALVLLAIVLSPVPTWLIVFPLWVAMLSVGFIQGNTTALAMAHAPDAAGAGSSLIGGVMSLVGGAISPLGGLAGDDTAVPFALVMAASGVCALAAFIAARMSVRRDPRSEAAFA